MQSVNDASRRGLPSLNAEDLEESSDSLPSPGGPSAYVPTAGRSSKREEQDDEFNRLFQQTAGTVTQASTVSRPFGSRPVPMRTPATSAPAPLSPDSPDADSGAGVGVREMGFGSRAKSLASRTASGAPVFRPTVGASAPSAAALRPARDGVSLDDILGETEAALRVPGTGQSKDKAVEPEESQALTQEGRQRAGSSGTSEGESIRPAAPVQVTGMSRYTLNTSNSSLETGPVTAPLPLGLDPHVYAPNAPNPSSDTSFINASAVSSPPQVSGDQEAGAEEEDDDLPMFGLGGMDSPPKAKSAHGKSARPVAAATAQAPAPTPMDPPHVPLPTPVPAPAPALGQRTLTVSPPTLGVTATNGIQAATSFSRPTAASSMADDGIPVPYSILAALQVELATTRSALDRLRHEANQALAAAHAGAAARIEALQAAHAAEGEATRVRHESRMRDALSAAEFDAQGSARAAAARLNAREAELAEMRSSMDRRVHESSLRARAEADAACEDRFSSSLLSARRAMDSEMASMIGAHETALAGMRRRHEQEVEVLKAHAEGGSLLSGLCSRMDSLVTGLLGVQEQLGSEAARVSTARGAHMDDRERLLSKLEDSAKSARESASKESSALSSVLSRLEAAVGEAKRELEHDRERLIAESARVSAWQSTLQADTQETRTSLATEKKELSELRSGLESDRRTLLAELAQAGRVREQAALEAARAVQEARADAEAVRASVGPLRAEVSALTRERDALCARVTALHGDIERVAMEQRVLAVEKAGVGEEKARMEAAVVGWKQSLEQSAQERERAGLDRREAESARAHARDALAAAQSKSSEAAIIASEAQQERASTAAARAEVAKERALLSKHRQELRRLLSTANEAGFAYALPSEDAAVLGMGTGHQAAHQNSLLGQSMHAEPGIPRHGAPVTAYPMHAPQQAMALDRSFLNASSLSMPHQGERDELRRKLAAVEADAARSTASLLQEQELLMARLGRRRPSVA